MIEDLVSFCILFFSLLCFASAMGTLLQEGMRRFYRGPVDHATSSMIEHEWERGAVLYVSVGPRRRSGYPAPSYTLTFVYVWVEGREKPIQLNWWVGRGTLKVYPENRNLSRQLERRMLAQLEKDYLPVCQWENPQRMQPPEELHDGQGQIHTHPRGADRSRGRSLEAAEAHAR